MILNADFEPLSVHPVKTLAWHDAVKSALSGRVIVVEEYDRVVRSSGSPVRASLEMRLPSVVALKEYQDLNRPVAFTRLGVYIRDRFTCCYCDTRYSMRELTFDHVIPRSKGGATNWCGIATACKECNTLKGNKSVAEAGLTLRRKPFAPTRYQLNAIARELPLPRRSMPDSWLPYLNFSEAALIDEDASAFREDGSTSVFPAGMTSYDYWNVELIQE